MDDDNAVRSAIEGAFEGKLAIADVVSQLPAWKTSFERMVNDILMYGWIWVGSTLITHQGEPALDSVKGKMALQILGDLAVEEEIRKELVEFFWNNAHNIEWVKALSPHLPGALLSDLVLRKHDGGVYGKIQTVSDLLVQWAPEPVRDSIARGAADTGRLVELYQKTDWGECRPYGQGSARDTMMACDLGL